jgi:hypothetical protein
VWLADASRAFVNATTRHAVCGRARKARRKVKLEEKRGARTNGSVMVDGRSGCVVRCERGRRANHVA